MSSDYRYREQARSYKGFAFHLTDIPAAGHSVQHRYWTRVSLAYDAGPSLSLGPVRSQDAAQTQNRRARDSAAGVGNRGDLRAGDFPQSPTRRSTGAAD